MKICETHFMKLNPKKKKKKLTQIRVIRIKEMCQSIKERVELVCVCVSRRAAMSGLHYWKILHTPCLGGTLTQFSIFLCRVLHFNG